MDSSLLWARSGPPPYPDVSKIPTPPLQEKGLVVMFLFPTLAIIIVAMRMYIRVTMRLVGLGKFDPDQQFARPTANPTVLR